MSIKQMKTLTVGDVTYKVTDEESLRLSHNTAADAHSDIRDAIAELENEVNSIAVPTQLSELADDTNYRTVSDVEKVRWNAKSDFSGDYNDLINTPDETIAELSDVIQTYILNIDYSVLAFDTSEIVFDYYGDSAVLGAAVLGQMVLL